MTPRLPRLSTPETGIRAELTMNTYSKTPIAQHIAHPGRSPSTLWDSPSIETRRHRFGVACRAIASADKSAIAVFPHLLSQAMGFRKSSAGWPESADTESTMGRVGSSPYSAPPKGQGTGGNQLFNFSFTALAGAKVSFFEAPI